jgi:hypothetical protein
VSFGSASKVRPAVAVRIMGSLNVGGLERLHKREEKRLFVIKRGKSGFNRISRGREFPADVEQHCRI